MLYFRFEQTLKRKSKTSKPRFIENIHIKALFKRFKRIKLPDKGEGEE